MSANPKVAGAFSARSGIVVEVAGKKAVPIATMSSIPSEAEFVAGHGAKYRPLAVKQATMDGREYTVIQLEQIA